MAAYVKAIKTSELADGTKKTVVVNNARLMIANVGGKFFAMDDACTHKGCSLGTEGTVIGSVVTCGCHGGKFNMTTGKVLAPPPLTDETSYTVKVEGDDVFVLI